MWASRVPATLGGMVSPEANDPEAAALAAAGPRRSEALGELLEQHRRRLLKMVHLRMDPRLKTRVGASDVLQEAFVEVNERVEAYLEDPRMPFFLWLRFITAQRLVALHRHHIGAQKRDVRRQVDAGIPSASTPALVDHLMASGTSPTQGVAREETRIRMGAALDRMPAADREILVLRHFEELSNAETAQELGIEPPAASKRYVRALRRLKDMLDDVGLDSGASPP